MNGFRILAVSTFAALVLAGASAPAGSSVATAGCGPAVVIHDPVLRETFAHFDRNQTSTSARLCAAYRNEMALAGR